MGYGGLHVCKEEVILKCFGFFGGERVHKMIIKQIGSCSFSTLVGSERNVYKMIRYCLIN